MGAWGYKVLDNDMAMDAMDEISDIVKNNIDALPFYTDLLILSRFESLQLLGIVILAICKVEPDEELYGTNYNHTKTWETIHKKANKDEAFREKMFHYSKFYMVETLNNIMEQLPNWVEAVRQERESYIKKIYAICEEINNEQIICSK